MRVALILEHVVGCRITGVDGVLHAVEAGGDYGRGQQIGVGTGAGQSVLDARVRQREQVGPRR